MLSEQCNYTVTQKKQSIFLRFKTNAMEQSHPREPNSHSTSQDIPRRLWNTKVHYRVFLKMIVEVLPFVYKYNESTRFR
jgi:hypothetical protein